MFQKFAKLEQKNDLCIIEFNNYKNYIMTTINTTFKNASLKEAYETLKQLREIRRDYVLPVEKIHMDYRGRIKLLGVDDLDNELQGMQDLGVSRLEQSAIYLSPTETAHSQIAGRFDIPKKYWDRMIANNPALAAKNLNDWIAYEMVAKQDKQRRMLARTYMDGDGETGTLRALLSDRYMVYDNLDLLTLALKKVQQVNTKTGLNIEVSQCELSETKLYVRFNCPDIRAEAQTALKEYRSPNGTDGGGLGISNGIVTGFVLSNSEVGQGRLTISPRVTILACNNGMVWDEEGFKRTHLGKKMEEGFIDWSQETRRKNIELIECEMVDLIEKFASEEYLSQRVSDIIEMAERKLEHPHEFIQNMCKDMDMSEAEQQGIFNAFIRQRDTSSVFSAAQAVTFYAQEADPDRRHELEVASTTLMGKADAYDKATAKVYKVTDN